MALIEEMRAVVRSLWEWMGFEASASTAANVVPVVVLGVALNVIALSVIGGVRPAKAMVAKEKVECLARVEMKAMQTGVVYVLRQVQGSRRTFCSATLWAAHRIADLRGVSGPRCERG